MSGVSGNMPRAYVFSTVCAVVAVALCIVGAVGAFAGDTATLKSLSWAKTDVTQVVTNNMVTKVQGTHADFELYIGLMKLYYTAKDDATAWTDFVCPDPKNCGVYYQCQDSLESIAELSLMFAIVTGLALISMGFRLYLQTDLAATLALITASLSITTGAIVVGLYNDNCYSDLLDQDVFVSLEESATGPPSMYTGTVSYSMGVGFMCVVFALMLQCLVFLAMLRADYDALLSTVGMWGFRFQKWWEVFVFGVVVAMMGVALDCVGTAITSDDLQTIKNVRLASSKVTEAVMVNVITKIPVKVSDFKVYYGINSLVYTAGDREESIHWGDFVCIDPDVSVCLPYYACKDTLSKEPSIVFCNMAICAVSVVVMALRLSSLDRPLLKVASLSISAVGLLVGSIGLILFNGGCYLDLSRGEKFSIFHKVEGGLPVVITGEATHEYGPGYICLLVGAVLQAFSILINLFIPVFKIKSSDEAKVSLFVFDNQDKNGICEDTICI